MFKKWKGFNIDYDYGTAVLLTNQKVEDPKDLFYELANQCFGIRKSIGEVSLLEEFDEIDFDSISIPEDKSVEKHPDLYDNPLSRMMKSMSPSEVIVPRKYEKKAKYILAHSGGDLIIWSDLETKIKSEWD